MLHRAPGSTGPTIAALLAACLLAAAAPSAAASPSAPYRIETVADGLSFPWALATLPDGRMLVTERPGRLRVLDLVPGGGHRLRAEPVAGLPPISVSGQRGCST